MRYKKIRTILTLLFLILPASAGKLAAQEPDYPTVLDSMYATLTRTVYQKYIKKEHRSIVFLPVVSRGELETTSSYNCNLVLVNRLKHRVQSSGDTLLKNIQVREGQFGDPGPDKTVFLEIEIEGKTLKVDSFQLDVRLKEVSGAGDSTIVETLNYSGCDENISKYEIPAPKISLTVWIFFIVTCLVILLEIFQRLPWKGKLDLRNRLLRQENFPYWRMAIISLFLIFLFSITLFIIKRNAIEGNAYFEGAEVHFFIDRNTGLFFDAGENNFVNLMQGILKETCRRISMKIRYPDTSELEKQGDLLTRLINWLLKKFGWQHYRLKKFADLKQSDYSYYIYTFSGENIDLRQNGNLAELVVDYDAIIAPVLKRMDAQVRQSSLVKPLGLLYNKLVAGRKESKPRKKFIIIFSDAAESFISEVETFLENVMDFYSNKDQYLRVFSVLFPNIPRTSSDDHIYPYEEGKILLLSKISEFIVYLNHVHRYTPEKLQNVNDLFYRMMAREEITADPAVETNYQRRLSRFKGLISHMEDKRLLNIHQIAKQDFLRNFVELTAIKQKKPTADGRLYNDFFLYTYVEGLFQKENLDFEHRGDWQNVGDYNLARGRLFGQPLDKEKMNQAITDIADTFVNQFIIIDKEPDKESLISKISISIAIFAVIFSIIYALLLFRYKYDVNYRVEKKDGVINGTMMGFILILLITTLVYFRYEDRWTIYGSWFWAFFISLVFLFSHYYLPLIFRRYLPPVLLGISRLYRKMPGRETSPDQVHYNLADSVFPFDESAWLKWLDRILFNILIAPLLCLSLFLQILSPVHKKGIVETKDPFISSMDTLFKEILNLWNYNKVIEYFLVLWMLVVGVYFIRAFIYSNTARAIK